MLYKTELLTQKKRLTWFPFYISNYINIPAYDFFGFAPWDFVVLVTGLPDPSWRVVMARRGNQNIFLLALAFSRPPPISFHPCFSSTPLHFSRICPLLSSTPCHYLYQKGHSSVSTRRISSWTEMTANNLPDLAGGGALWKG